MDINTENLCVEDVVNLSTEELINYIQSDGTSHNNTNSDLSLCDPDTIRQYLEDYGVAEFKLMLISTLLGIKSSRRPLNPSNFPSHPSNDEEDNNNYPTKSSSFSTEFNHYEKMYKLRKCTVHLVDIAVAKKKKTEGKIINDESLTFIKIEEEERESDIEIRYEKYFHCENCPEKFYSQESLEDHSQFCAKKKKKKNPASNSVKIVSTMSLKSEIEDMKVKNLRNSVKNVGFRDEEEWNPLMESATESNSKESSESESHFENESSSLSMEQVESDGQFTKNIERKTRRSCRKMSEKNNQMDPHNEGQDDDNVERTKGPVLQMKKCPVIPCKKEYLRWASLARHLKQNHPTFLPFVCPVDSCAKNFSLDHFLNVHMGQVHPQHSQKKKTAVSYPCDVEGCGRILSTRTCLLDHVLGAHCEDGRQYECSVKSCGKKFVKKMGLVQHMKSHRSLQESLQCPIPHCDMKAYYKASVLKHLRLVHRLVLDCGTCRRKFIREIDMNEHIKNVHLKEEKDKIPKFLCTHGGGCDLGFYSEQKLEMHTKNFHFNSKTGQEDEKEEEEGSAKKRKKMGPSVRAKDEKFSSDEANLNDQQQPSLQSNQNEISHMICPIENCSRKLFSLLALDNHLHQGHKLNAVDQQEDRQLICHLEDCGQIFPRWFPFREHLVKSHAAQNCVRYCQKSTVSHKKRIRTKPSMSQRRRVRKFCLACLVSFETVQQMEVHEEEVHSQDKPFKCSQCYRRFRIDSLRNGHELSFHTREFGCHIPNCDFVSRDEEILKKHVEQSHRRLSDDKKIFKCPVTPCTCQYSHSRCLREHLNAAHPQYLPLACPVESCANKFALEQSLKWHIRRKHDYNYSIKKSKDGRYPCELEGCNRIFKSKDGHRGHFMSTHCEDGLQFPCEVEGCGKKFVRKSSLNEHMRTTHSTEKNFQCPAPHCLLKSAHESYVQRHIKMVHGVTLNCGRGSCRRKFICELAMNDHIKTIHLTSEKDKVAKFLCPIGDQCGRGFYCAEKLVGHVKLFHSNPPTENPPTKWPHHRWFRV